MHKMLNPLSTTDIQAVNFRCMGALIIGSRVVNFHCMGASIIGSRVVNCHCIKASIIDLTKPQVASLMGEIFVVLCLR